MRSDRGGTRVLLVDDHPVVRQGLAALLRDEGFDVLAAAGTSAEALAVLGRTPVDVVVLDLSLDDESGLALLPSIHAVVPEARVVIYSVHEDSDRLRRAFEAGAMGYATKREDPEVLVQGVDAIRAGERFMSPRAARVMAEALARGPQRSPEAVLSAKELEAYTLLGRGHGTQEIAARMGVSPRTVETYYDRVLTKLHLPSRRELRVHAAQARPIGAVR